MTPEILIVDRNGTPREWRTAKDGACYYARDKVIWETGNTYKVFTGGHDKDGEVSRIDVKTILGVTGPLFGKEFYERETVYAVRPILYARDRYLCAYCGNVYREHHLTIDHVMPRSRGGRNTWINTVTACKPCNTAKGNMTPEEWGTHLLYLPFAPNQFEKMILKHRKILADQMDFLLARVSKNFRLQLN